MKTIFKRSASRISLEIYKLEKIELCIMKKNLILFVGLAFFTYKNQAQTVIDYDGNVYNTITIGTQEWMKEDLKVTHYRNGNPIPKVTDNIMWSNLTTGAYCWYNNDSATYENPYGKLYNWYTVNTEIICPTGWHVPSDAEWTTLTTYLGGESVAGGKMKETGIAHWSNPNIGATNTSGFTGLGGGDRYSDGGFFYAGISGDYWSSTEYSTTEAYDRFLYNQDTYVYQEHYDKRLGFYIRCVMDSVTTQINENRLNMRMQIYPNPATDIVTLNINNADNEDLEINIYNIMGVIVGSEILKQNQQQINIGDLSNGVYMVTIKTKDFAENQRLIIQR